MANPIEDSDDLAKAVGRLAGRWGVAEFAVDLIFSSLLGADYRKTTIVFSFFKTIATQVDIIELLLEETSNLSTDEKAQCKKALRAFKAKAPERNAIIHYPFGYADAGDSGQVLYKTRTQRRGEQLHWAEPTSPEAIMTFADEIKTIADNLISAHSVVWQASLRTPLSPPHLPGLAQSEPPLDQGQQ